MYDYTDRATCIIFGDGAGAAFLNQNEGFGLQDEYLRSDGARKRIFRKLSRRFLYPDFMKILEKGQHFISKREKQYLNMLFPTWRMQL